MILGRWSVCLLLPLVVLLERLSYYSMRSVLFAELAGNDAFEDASRQISHVTWLLLSTTPLGGLLALAIKPRWTLVAGLAIAAAGYAVLSASGPRSVSAFLPLAIGLGLARPALYATAAVALRDPLESGRNTLFVGLYLATNAGAFGAQVLGGLLQGYAFGGSGSRFPLLSGLAAGAVTVGALLALAIALAPRFDRVPEPRDPPFTGRGELGALLVMVLALPVSLVLHFGGTMQYDAFYRLPDPVPPWLHYLNPSTVIAAGTLLLAGLGTAAVIGKRIPALYVAGAGFVLTALSCLPLLAAAADAPGVARAGALASLVVMAAAEVLCFPFVMSRMAAGPHPRTACLMIALWLMALSAIPQGIMTLQRWASGGAGDLGALPGVLTGLSAAAALVTGLVAITVQYAAGARIWGNESPGSDAAGSDPDAGLATQP